MRKSNHPKTVKVTTKSVNRVTPWLTSLGVQNTFISAAFLSMATSLVFLIMIKWGKSFRDRSKYRYWGYVAQGKALGLSH